MTINVNIFPNPTNYRESNEWDGIHPPFYVNVELFIFIIQVIVLHFDNRCGFDNAVSCVHRILKGKKKHFTETWFASDIEKWRIICFNYFTRIDWKKMLGALLCYFDATRIISTRMHSSRMRTVLCSNHLQGRVCLGVFAQGGLPGGCLPGGVSQHALRLTPPVNRMTNRQV